MVKVKKETKKVATKKTVKKTNCKCAKKSTCKAKKTTKPVKVTVAAPVAPVKKSFWTKVKEFFGF